MQIITVALVGNPNGGKTTLFNALTGGHQGVGNWAGVTVELKQGQFKHAGVQVKLIDLPGCYTLDTSDTSETLAIDEKIAVDYILSRQCSVMVNVLDVLHLDRHLYLTLQLLEHCQSEGIPIIVVVNRMDLARKAGISINLPALACRLNCPVMGMTALSDPLLDLKETILKQAVLKQEREGSFAKILVEQTATVMEAGSGLVRDHLSAVLTKTALDKPSFTASLDTLFLNRWLGLPLFFLLMYGLFGFTTEVGGKFQTLFSEGLHFFCVEQLAAALESLEAPNWLIGLLSRGLGQGIETTLTFIPVLTCMFLGLAFLKNSGYMARAAFVMDKIMQLIGLSGRSFLPLILGFGCNVPAVLAARTLENRRERILIILMTPFMSCGARLAIYALFVAAFFKDQGPNLIFGLYLTGILVALLTGLALRHSLLKKEDPHSFVMELPTYQLPNVKLLLRITYQRVREFLLKAGVIIIPFCMCIGLLASLKTPQEENWLTVIGKLMTPIFSPMGIEQDNWPATMGLVTGVLAKEVVVGTLSALYAEQSEGQPVLGVMAERFGSAEAAMAYLLFVLLYFPCISVLATIARELTVRWAVFSAIWTTGIAYGVAVLFYQSTQFFHHPFYSGVWISGILLSGGLGFYILKIWVCQSPFQKRRAFPTPIIVAKECI